MFFKFFYAEIFIEFDGIKGAWIDKDERNLFVRLCRTKITISKLNRGNRSDTKRTEPSTRPNPGSYGKS
jgi:hypothetical protein